LVVPRNEVRAIRMRARWQHLADMVHADEFLARPRIDHEVAREEAAAIDKARAERRATRSFLALRPALPAVVLGTVARVVPVEVAPHVTAERIVELELHPRDPATLLARREVALDVRALTVSVIEPV